MRRAALPDPEGSRAAPERARGRLTRRRLTATAAAVVLAVALAPPRSAFADLWSLLLAPFRALAVAVESASAPAADEGSTCPPDTVCAPPEEPDPGKEKGPSIDPNGNDVGDGGAVEP